LRIHQEKTGGLFLLLFGTRRLRRPIGRDDSATDGLPTERRGAVPGALGASAATASRSRTRTSSRPWSRRSSACPSACSRRSRRLRPWEDNLKGQPFLPRLRVYESLALIDGRRRRRCRRARRRVVRNLRQLKRWAAWAPANYAHFYWIVEAERRRRWGRTGDALEAFERAAALPNRSELQRR
jgi:hypothetical protein